MLSTALCFYIQTRSNMFNKKTRRNFRQRREESSEEDEGGDRGDGTKADSSLHSEKNVNVQRRGISCSSKPNATPPHQRAGSDSSGAEDPEEPSALARRTKEQPSSQTLSFGEDKDGESQSALASRTDLTSYFYTEVFTNLLT